MPSLLAALTLATVAVLDVSASGPDCGAAGAAPLATVEGDQLLVRAPLVAAADATQTSYAFKDARCTHRLRLDLPEGKRLAVSAVRYPLELRLETSSGASHGITLRTDAAAPLVRSAPGISGPAFGTVWQSWSFPSETAVRTGCGGEQALELTVQALARAMQGRRALVRIRADLPGEPGAALRFALEDCEP